MDVSVLVKRSQRGDNEAFIELIKNYEKILYNVAKKFMLGEEDIADVLQETILIAFEKISTLRDAQYFNTWLYRIFINECKKILRRKPEMLFDESIQNIGEDTSIHHGDNLTFLEFQEAFSQLSMKYREVIILYYYLGMSLAEISSTLSLPIGTVKSQLSRAEKQLKYYMKKIGGDIYGQV